MAACLRSRDWYQKNKERAKLSQAAYISAHKKEICEYKKTTYEANKSAISEQQKIYYQLNKDRIKARVSAHQKENQDAANERTKKYIAKYPERHRAHCKAWEKANPEAVARKSHDRRARKNFAGGKLSKGITTALMTQQGGECVYCKTDIREDYHLDHRMPLKLGGAHADGNMQLTCPQCNRKKGAKHPDIFAAICCAKQ